MAIEGTALQADVNWVISSPAKATYTYTVEFHCGATKKVIPTKMISIDYLQDFEEGFADEIVLECMFVWDDYDQTLFPYRDQTLVTIARNTIGAVSDAIDSSIPGAAKVFRATMTNPSSAAMSAGTQYLSPGDKYTSLGLIKVKYQLIDLAVEQLMLVTTGGIFRKTEPGTVLLAELTRQSHQLVGLDVSDAVKGVDMVPVPKPEGQPKPTVRSHVVIPQGTRLVDLAGYIQKKAGGIYDTGLGCYYQKNNWYVYPTYDVTRFPKAKKTMTILVVHSQELPAADNTWRLDGESLTVVANGKLQHLDKTDHQALNHGNGVRYAKAQDLLDNFTPGVSSDITAKSSNVATGFVTQVRDSQKNNVQFSKNRITDNMQQELSKLSERQGQRIQLNWDRADVSLVSPGMPVRVLYEVNSTLFEMMGTVLNLQSQVRLDQPGLTSSRYITACGMTLFVAVTKTTKVA